MIPDESVVEYELIPLWIEFLTLNIINYWWNDIAKLFDEMISLNCLQVDFFFRKKRKKTVKSSTTENQYFKTNIDFNERMNRTSCPKSRTPNDENECPETHPYLNTNKYNDKCCYKTSSKAVKGCPKQRRPVSGECSDMFPHARKNKHNVDCCYKKKKSVVPTW